MNLDTAAKILEALEKFCHADASGEREVWFSKGVDPLAERLALGQRVLELVEKHARNCGWLEQNLDAESFLQIWIKEDINE